MAIRPKTGSKMPRTIIMRDPGIAGGERGGKSLARPSRVLRQAQDEVLSSWHLEHAILGLPHPELVEGRMGSRAASIAWRNGRMRDRLADRTNPRGGIADAVDGARRSLLDRASRADRGAVARIARRAARRAGVSRPLLALEPRRINLAHPRLSLRRL